MAYVVQILELLYANKIARRRALAVFLRADGAAAAGGGKAAHGGGTGGSDHSQPQPVYWMPVKFGEATLALKERQQKQLLEWEVRRVGPGAARVRGRCRGEGTGDAGNKGAQTHH
jgi:hypothetical protein